ncbi:hypothetical protein [Algoriphagus yeomjeoni]|uniref:Uncharacterized protein n=1 Tax=Algoriphagus yeomjeoni TaxID=291403 RepID=A0A327NVL4_9BACT|nr:hypothetical protein [Algoriphagus yeomjeoni]RAI84188.1 hypothetical protein LV83_04081 [Algoriphagus yeomjeoni]
MSWGTKEQKGELALLGLESGLSLLNSMFEESKKFKKEAKEDPKLIDDTELLRILDINEEYTTRVNNLLYDTELGCKFKRTEEIFLMIIEVIMLDLEYDYEEVIKNFTNSFDNEAFIEAHDQAMKLRTERLKNEYDANLIQYNVDYEAYLENKKNTGFFKSIFGESLVEPSKPILRS